MNRTPVLSRFDMQVLKSANPTTDPAMIAIGAVVNIYRQGATTTTDKPIPSDTTSEVTLPVYNTGSVEKSPTSPPQSYLVNIDGDPTRQLRVTDVSPSAMTIKVTNTTTTGFLLLALEPARFDTRS